MADILSDLLSDNSTKSPSSGPKKFLSTIKKSQTAIGNDTKSSSNNYTKDNFNTKADNQVKILFILE